MHKLQQTYDIIVIGGGPAGMMAAGRAAELGAKVALIEKNPELGKKLLITGGGRCNLMNYKPDIHLFLDKFGESKKFLFSTFSQFGISETLNFFNDRGLATKIEDEDRVFPVSNSSKTVLDLLLNYLKSERVHLILNATTRGLIIEHGEIKGAELEINREKIKLFAKKIILATGGSSRPETGSTGDGFLWLRSIGHKIPETAAALAPVKIKEAWVKRLAGLSLRNIKLIISANNRKIKTESGKLLFTHFGLSGPLVLNHSRLIGELLESAPVQITLDLRPETDSHVLDQEFQKYLSDRQNRLIKNALTGFVPSSLAPALISLAELDGEKQVNLLSRAERLKIIKLIKNLSLTVTGLMGLEKAIITRGGVDLTEVNLRTMQSRRQNNLYITGDLLDINRPSGGYSLQLCWTTGYVAGTWAAKNLK